MNNSIGNLGVRPIISWLLILLITGSVCHAQPFALKYLSIKDGLSQASVTCFEQDSEGFIWVGTRDGLNRFDGYTFKVYKQDLNDSTSLVGNYVRTIFLDRAGRVIVRMPL